MSSTSRINKSSVNKILNVLGSGLAVVGVIFVISRLHGYWNSAHLETMSVSTWSSITGLALLYGLSNILLALAWRDILNHCQLDIKSAWVIRTYGISQLAKYIPGNIFQIAGRQALGMASGLPSKGILKSNIYELMLIAIAGSTSIWLALPIIFPSIPFLAGLILTLVNMAGIYILLRIYLSQYLSTAFMFQTLFLIISSIIFVTILSLINNGQYIDYISYIYIGATYIIAWLAGLITPGSPAGVGIRELVIIFLLKNIIPESDLLLAVVLGRVVTVIGDIIFYGFAHSISKNSL